MIPRPHVRRKPDFSLATINIVFLLLLFFLVAGTIVQKSELSVDLAETTSIPLERLPRPLLLIDRSGELRLNGNPVARRDLPASINRFFEDTKDEKRRLNVLAPRQSGARELVDLVSELQAADISVRLVTLRASRAGSGDR